MNFRMWATVLTDLSISHFRLSGLYKEVGMPVAAELALKESKLEENQAHAWMTAAELLEKNGVMLQEGAND